MQITSLSRIAIVALAGGLCLADYGLGVTPAIADPPVKEDALAGLTQNWDKVLPVNSRFVILPAFNSEAVRDNETRLVWEKSPDRLTVYPWIDALALCANKAVGGRKGWRLPSFIELSSLVDPNTVSSPTLPAGHPITTIEAAFYWSATTLTGAGGITNAWGVFFNNGFVGLNGKPNGFFACCVRGDMNAEVY